RSRATRKDGAAITVIVVPRDAANAMGIISCDAGRFLLRFRLRITGSIMAVTIRWWENAAISATDGMITSTALQMLSPESWPIHRPSLSVRPVWLNPPDRTNIEASRIR